MQLSPELYTLWKSKPTHSLPAAEWERKIKSLVSEQKPKAKWRPLLRYAAAALIIIAAGTYTWRHAKQHAANLPEATATKSKQDIPPGTNGAILSFSNGKTIVLDTARNGLLLDGVTKNGGSVQISGSSVEYATLTTPRAKQQQLVLHDGTKVWLNAASSIRFPSSFVTGKREVEITGEAYFEVAKDAAKPFIVHVGASSIQVLGTHFNVMAYSNEQSLQTTLLEGSVKFMSGTKSVLLKPGQQSQLTGGNQVTVVPDVDVEMAVAWKNGKQAFSKSGIQAIMRQVERWYDVDIVYEGEVTKRTFSGDIARSANLSELLKLLEANNIHCVLDAPNKKLTIMP